jgi:uncharacterized protein (TIGR02300 family)
MDAATDLRRKQRGTKRVCKSCEEKFYDLGRDPTVCPMCQSSLPLAGFARPPEPARSGYTGVWSRKAVPLKVLPVEDELAPIPDDEAPADEASSEAPAAEAHAVLEQEDGIESDVSDLVSPDDEASPDE